MFNNVTNTITSNVSKLIGSDTKKNQNVITQKLKNEFEDQCKLAGGEPSRIGKIQNLCNVFIKEVLQDHDTAYSMNIFNDESNENWVYIEFIDNTANESLYQVQIRCTSSKEFSALHEMLSGLPNSGQKTLPNLNLNLNISEKSKSKEAIMQFKSIIECNLTKCKNDDNKKKLIINTAKSALEFMQSEINCIGTENSNKFKRSGNINDELFNLLTQRNVYTEDGLRVKPGLERICQGNGKNMSINKSSFFGGSGYSIAAKEVMNWLDSQLKLLDVNKSTPFVQKIISKSEKTENSAAVNKAPSSKVDPETITAIVNDTTDKISIMLGKDVFDNNHDEQIKLDYDRSSGYNIKIREGEIKLSECVNKNTLEVTEENKSFSAAQKKIVPLLINQNYISNLGMSVSMACALKDITLPKFSSESKFLFEFTQDLANTDLSSIERIRILANNVSLTAVNMILKYENVGSNVMLKVTVYFNNLEVDKIHEAKFATNNSGLFGYKIWPITMELDSDSTKVEQIRIK